MSDSNFEVIVFAAGAVRAGYGGLLTHAVAEGSLAAKAVSARFGG